MAVAVVGGGVVGGCGVGVVGDEDDEHTAVLAVPVVVMSVV